MYVKSQGKRVNLLVAERITANGFEISYEQAAEMLETHLQDLLAACGDELSQGVNGDRAQVLLSFYLKAVTERNNLNRLLHSEYASGEARALIIKSPKRVVVGLDPIVDAGPEYKGLV